MRLRRTRVPWTDFLADVASEGVAVEMMLDRAAMFDREIADAVLRRDSPIGKDGVGRTGIDASRACAATIRDRSGFDVIRQRREQRADEKV